MKCLLLAPMRYPFVRAIQAGLEGSGFEVIGADFAEFFSRRTNNFVNKFASLPKRVKDHWERPYTKKVNEEYRRLFAEHRPELVFIYNNQLIEPEVLAEFRRKAKVAFVLGDNPLYTRTSNLHNLHILFEADYIISPDSMWRDQLTRMGVKNIHFDCFGYHSGIYHPMEVSAEDLEKYRSDFIYVGSANKSNWGYKRTLFLNLFRDMDLRAYISGKGAERWVDFFPELQGKVLEHNRFDAGFNNLVYNCSKIAPVEQVPSLFHGIHVRAIDALGAGILPLCEYSKDLACLFDGLEVPMIGDYEEGREMARYWLEHEQERQECVARMRKRIEENYEPTMVVGRMMEYVFN